MNKKFERPVVVVLFLVASVIAWALSPMGGKSPTGTIIPISLDADGKVETTAVVTVGTATIDVTPAFMEDSTTASSAILTSAGYVPVEVKNSEIVIVGSSTGTPVPISGAITATVEDGLVVVGSSTGTPLPIVDPKAYDAASTSYTQAYTELATNTVKLLSAVCSFTVPCELVFYTNADMYYGPSTTASATLQGGHKKAEDTEWSIKPASTGFDMALIAAPAAKASFTVTVFPLVVAP